jgi:hypothetical protein
MDPGDRHDTVARDGHAERAEPSVLEEAASPAEREFIERVRRDRARSRALAQRTVVVAGLIAVFAGLLFVLGVPSRLAVGTRPAMSNESTTPAALPAPTAPTPRRHNDDPVLQQRVDRLEARLGEVEERAAVLERHVQGSVSAGRNDARRAAVRPVPPSGTPRSTATSAPPRPPVKAATVSTKRHTPISSRDVARRPEPEVTFTERVRLGWETFERHVRRTPDELRDGFNKAKRLFSDAVIRPISERGG